MKQVAVAPRMDVVGRYWRRSGHDNWNLFSLSVLLDG